MKTFTQNHPANNETLNELLVAVVNMSNNNAEQPAENETRAAYMLGRQIAFMSVLADKIAGLWLWGCDTYRDSEAIKEAARVILANAEQWAKVADMSISNIMDEYDRVMHWADDKTNHTETDTEEYDLTSEHKTEAEEIERQADEMAQSQWEAEHAGAFTVDSFHDLDKLHAQIKTNHPDAVLYMNYYGQLYTANDDVITHRTMFGRCGYPSTLVSVSETAQEVAAKAVMKGHRVAFVDVVKA